MTSQSEAQSSTFSVEEMEFVAEDELIEIVPKMRMEPLNMICGDFGPFLYQITTQVPICLAVALKKRGKCTIRPPGWMFIAHVFNSAREDIPDIYMMRSLIEDIRDVRFHKVATNLRYAVAL